MNYMTPLQSIVALGWLLLGKIYQQYKNNSPVISAVYSFYSDLRCVAGIVLVLADVLYVTNMK